MARPAGGDSCGSGPVNRAEAEKDVPLQPQCADAPVSPARLYLALIHYPVLDRKGEIIAAAVTNLDLHDIARAARTYGVKAFYCITPLADQRALMQELVRHWTAGYGARHNPDRCAAMGLLRISDSLEKAVDAVTAEEGEAPLTVATSARRQPGTIDFSTLRNRLSAGRPHILMLGTASGLAPQTIKACDAVLEPIEGGGYNHLSVRSAAAIILDRLLAGSRMKTGPSR